MQKNSMLKALGLAAACATLAGTTEAQATRKKTQDQAPLSASATGKLATRPPVTYANRYELYTGVGLQTFQAGQNLPKKMIFGNVEVQGTRWMGPRLGLVADFRGGAGTTQVFPNSDLSRPLVVQYTGLGGVQFRGPKNQFAALNYHAFAGGMHGVFDKTARQDINVGLYTNRTGPVGVVGASLDLNYSRHIALRLSPDLMFEHLGDETREFFALSGGIVYRFGSR